MLKKTSGDVFRINITPPADSYPFITIFRHPCGIRKAGEGIGEEIGGRNASKEETALQIGNAIIKHSEVLKKWSWPKNKRIK